MASVSTIYNVEIYPFHSIEECPSTLFTVLEHRVNGTALEVFIEYKSQANPEVQAFWDNVGRMLYLVGGKIDEPTEVKRGAYRIYELAKANKVWVSIDLSTLEKSGQILVFKINSEKRCIGNSLDESRKICNAQEEFLMTISL